MATKSLKLRDVLPTILAVKKYIERGYTTSGTSNETGAYSMASEELGVARSTVRARCQWAKDRLGVTPENVIEMAESAYDESDELPDPLEVLARHTRANAEYIAKKRRKPVVFLVKPEPFAVAFIGDPHLSNAGCNLEALKDDIDLLVAAGIRAVQMGDVLDNFHKIGKLAEKEALNRMSVPEAQAIARWLILGPGDGGWVKWDAHILGNHDAWLGYEGILAMGEWVKQARSRLFDWNAKLIYDWGTGQHVIAASHDMKGNSQYNPTHGPAKMALWDGTADTYVAAHRHNHAEAKVPNGWRGKTYQLVRVRGYKDHDSYSAGRAQFPSHEGMEGRSALLVINPLSETHDGRQRVFMDLAEGVEFLQMLKRRVGANA